MDRIGADFHGTIQQMRDKLGARPLILQLPLGKEATFKGVVDLVTNQAVVWDEDTLGVTYTSIPVPSEYEEEVSKYRDQLFETVAEGDDHLLEKYLSGEEVSSDEALAVIRKLTLQYEVTPILCGSALRNKGIQPILDAIVRYLPSPADIPPVAGTNPRTNEQEVRPCSDTASLSAFTFKVLSDEEKRKLVFLRVYSGVIKAESPVYNASNNKTERIARLFRMHSNKRERLKEARAGDIVAAVGLKNTITGDTLCDQKDPILLEPLDFYRPVMSIAIEPKTRADMDKLDAALSKLVDEDPTFTVKHDEDSNQTIISGMGELHLDVLVNRLLQDFSVNVNVGKPQVVYRETITKAVEHEVTFDREIAGARNFGNVTLRLEPLDKGSGIQYSSALPEDAIPPDFLEAIEVGSREGALSGVVAGYPMLDMNVTLINADFRDNIATVMAYKIAASMAVKEGCEKAGPVLLEPIMAIDVVVPEEFMGEVIGDLNARRGKLGKVSPKGKVSVIKASVPLKEMFGYSTSLRSASQGRGTFSMQFSHYDQVS
jgi:elongation factor G